MYIHTHTRTYDVNVPGRQPAGPPRQGEVRSGWRGTSRCRPQAGFQSIVMFRSTLNDTNHTNNHANILRICCSTLKYKSAIVCNLRSGRREFARVLRPQAGFQTLLLLPATVKTTSLRTTIRTEMLAFRAPNQGLESSLCCWTAGQGLPQKECCFTDTTIIRRPFEHPVQP